MNLSAYIPLVISRDGAGLCNVLFNVINGIIKNGNGNKIILLDEVYSDYSKKDKVCISELLDLTEMNRGLRNLGFEVTLIDRTKCELNNVSCQYGFEDKWIDVTNFFRNDSFLILKEWSLNSLFSDPCPGKVKTLKMKYTIDGSEFFDTFSEQLNHDIVWNRNILQNDVWASSKYEFSWYNAYDEVLFQKIVKTVRFNARFYEICEEIIKEVGTIRNVVHLRIENDAITHWSKQNRLSEEKFEIDLHEKYRFAIYNNIPQGQNILILSYIKQDHPFLLKLKQDYNVILIEKEKYINGGPRELCAIIDLILATYCSGIFIGNHSFKFNRGSTFSYIISSLISKFETKIFIDLDDIKQDYEYF
jgi:hypothetical protein